MNIGLIDFGYRTWNLNSMKKLYDCIEYAMLGERLGYDKFWIGEHHTSERTLPWNNATNLIPILASKTERISIGTAGTLMCIHNPYHVASSYKFFNNVFSNRIDLGFANGKPYRGTAMHATGKNNVLIVNEFEEKVTETVRLLNNEESYYLNDGLVMPPYKGLLPELWTLGSSQRSIERAIELGTNLGFWISQGFCIEEKERIAKYKSDFFSKHSFYPKVRAVVSGICHLSEKKAKAIARQQGETKELLCGTPSMFQDLLLRYSDFYNINSFMFLNLIQDPSERIKGVEKLSYQLNLQTEIKSKRKASQNHS